MTRDHRVRLSVVVPVYRNAETLFELVERLHLALDSSQIGPRHELIFVVDACPDKSEERLQTLLDFDRRLRIMVLGRNVGQHMAVMIGLQQARGRWAVILDADLQDPPEAVPGLIAAAEATTQVVFAGRRGLYQGFGRLLTSRIFKAVLHWTTGVPRDAGIFLAVRRETLGRLLCLPTRRPFVVAMIGALKVEMLSVPTERSAREVGHSTYSSWGRLRSAWRAFLCYSDCRRPVDGSVSPPWRSTDELELERWGFTGGSGKV